MFAEFADAFFFAAVVVVVAPGAVPQLRLFVGRAAVTQAGAQLRFFESRITFIGGARYSMHPRLVPGLAELSNTIIVACAASLHLEFLGCACGMAVLVVLEASPQHLGAGA